MDHLDLAPIVTARGSVALPGSKSISNRVLLLSALARGTTDIDELLDADDTRVMIAALETLGVGLERLDPDTPHALRVHGVEGAFPVRKAELFLGNAGTAFRSLTAALALAGGEYRLSGVPRMHERPIGDLVDGLRGLGARIDYLGNDGYPPLALRGVAGVAASSAPGQALATRVRGNVSSQFLTALLMALPLIARTVPARLEVVGELISKPYVDITLNLMARYGVTVEREGWSAFTVPAGQVYRSPGVLQVEGDASSASYFLALGAIAAGPVTVTGVGRDSIQGDVRFVDALRAMGASVEMAEHAITVRGITVAHGARLSAIDADFNHIPDAAMTVAVLALFADGPSTLRNIGSWRVKETDRIAAMATELAKLGATVEAGTDFLRVTPPARLTSAAIDTYDDHRMAMCFSLAACGGVGVRINHPECVAKTFPDYFAVLATLLGGAR